MHYRPDIDGLRAIAIIFVLCFHGGLTLFPAGFIGVDVFFVISGFLITGIIVDRLLTNTFSFTGFYARRLWRLQPVFLSMLVISTLVSLLFFLPDDLIEYSRSVRKASLFISNMFFDKVTSGYFSPDNSQLPLLHTWSLSIEWQCYLLLPLGIYVLYRLFGRTWLHLVVASLTCIFFMCSLYASWHHPANTYYHLASRIFEFLIGATIALTPWVRCIPHKMIIELVGILASLSLIYIASLSHIMLGFPNGYALIVCCATAALIVIGQYPVPSLITRFLSLRPVVLIGLLSYSLYCWHWPIFAFMQYQGIQQTPMVLFSVFVCVFICAYLSWRFIEQPARRFNRMQWLYTFVCLYIVPVLMIHVGANMVRQHSGFPARFQPELVYIYEQLNKYQSPDRPLCISNNRVDAKAHCQIGAADIGSKKGLMIGDSYSNHYWGFMDTLAKDAHLSIMVQGTSSCLALPGIYLYDWWHFKDSVYQECFDETARYYAMIQANHYDVVIVAQVWANYFGTHVLHRLKDTRSSTLTKKRIKQALNRALKIIIDSGAKPVLIKSTAAMQPDMQHCFFRHIQLRRAYHSESCSFLLQKNEDEQWLDALFKELAHQYPQLVVIDPKRLQCPKGRCRADINGIPMYRDAGHITDYASYQLGSIYLQRYVNPV
jgi:peptidoglycan/LPS O-acetylase OafA/YrhL